MVTDRDITCRGLANSKRPAKLTARDVMTKGIVYRTEGEKFARTIARPVLPVDFLQAEDVGAHSLDLRSQDGDTGVERNTSVGRC
jgi:hypothetical protein